jgi:ribosomal protein S12 methylthiotransferase
MAAPESKGRFQFVSLGCAKNTVDSERMLGLLVQDGYHLVPEGSPADLVIVNTCGFLEASRAESIEVIEEMVDRKKAGKLRGVLVAGCLAERWKDRLQEEIPGIDQVLGVFGREEVARAADRIMGALDEQRTLFRPAPVQALDDTARLRITPRHYAYLKVSEGCDRACTFCSIPLMRGKHQSKPMDRILAEARELASDGVRELILVAQDMTYYGMDLYGEPRLASLLQRLGELPELDWIRVLYCYPQYFTDELYEVLASTPLIIPYLDMPLQHINDRLLKRMNRRHNRAESESIINRLRKTVTGLVLRTTLIVGFPGETDEEFEELMGFVGEARFERLGVFTYSYEPDTPSARMTDHLSSEEKESRRAALLERQQGIAFEFQRSLVGKNLDVLIDSPDAERPRLFLGRTYADAPEIDGVVRVIGRGIRPGDLVRCEIVEADGYDLTARPVQGERRVTRPRANRGASSPLSILPG